MQKWANDVEHIAVVPRTGGEGLLLPPKALRVSMTPGEGKNGHMAKSVPHQGCTLRCRTLATVLRYSWSTCAAVRA